MTQERGGGGGESAGGVSVGGAQGAGASMGGGDIAGVEEVGGGSMEGGARAGVDAQAGVPLGGEGPLGGGAEGGGGVEPTLGGAVAGASPSGGVMGAGGDEALTTAELSVQLRYQDRVYDETGYRGEHVRRAAPGLKVTLVLDEEWSSEGTEATPIAVGYTDQAGEVRFTFERPEEALRVVALSELEWIGHRAVVRDPLGSRPLYALESDPLPPDVAQVTLTSPEEGPLSGALNILAVTSLGFSQLSAHGVQPGPLLSYYWRPGQPFSCGSCYQGNQISLGGQVEDPDQYDDHIILHEMGHFMVDVWSLDSSPGGAHRGRVVSPALAYGEGVAYFWSALVLSAPLVVDWLYPSPWTVDLETGVLNGAQTSIGVDAYGRHHEELVSSFLWDAYDDVEDSLNGVTDRVHMGEDQVMSALLSELPARSLEYLSQGVELADWIEAARCVSPEQSWHLDQLSVARQYPWSSGETGVDLESGRRLTGGQCALKGAPRYQIEERGDELWLTHHPEWARGLQMTNSRPLTVSVSVGVPPDLTPFKGSLECSKLPCLISPSEEQGSRERLTLPLVVVAGTHSASWTSRLASRRLLEGGRPGAVRGIKKAPIGALWVERATR